MKSENVKSKIMLGILGALLILLTPIVVARADTVGDAPLTVTPSSKLVLMDFEPWFSPGGDHFDQNGNTVRPAVVIGTSSDMVSIGGGYDSSDPKIIDNQMKYIQNLGADAIVVDLTNALGCQFYAGFCPGADAATREQQFENNDWLNNVSAIYKELSALNKNGNSTIKIVPLLGGLTPTDFEKLPLGNPGEGKTPIQLETDFFLGLEQKYPNLTVVYQGKPLMLYFHGAGQGLLNAPEYDGSGNQIWPVQWWQQTDIDLQSAISSVTGLSYADSITYRHVAGYFDDQPQNRNIEGAVSSIIEGGTHPQNGFWTWIDRYNPSANLYPSYDLGNGGVEAFSAAFAAPGKTAALWGSPPSSYAPDDTLANNGAAFSSYMSQAAALKPTFLLINQWNEYLPYEQGFDANTRNDIEPNTLWGVYRVNYVGAAIKNYKSAFGITITPFKDLSAPPSVSPPAPTSTPPNLTSTVVTSPATSTLNVIPNSVSSPSDPVIFSISPISGPVGTTITIKGSNFSFSGNKVIFGSRAITNLNSADGQTIIFTLASSLGPNCQPKQKCQNDKWTVVDGLYPVLVVNAQNKMSNPKIFTVTDVLSGTSPTFPGYNDGGGDISGTGYSTPRKEQ